MALSGAFAGHYCLSDSKCHATTLASCCCRVIASMCSQAVKGNHRTMCCCMGVGLGSSVACYMTPSCLLWQTDVGLTCTALCLLQACSGLLQGLLCAYWVPGAAALDSHCCQAPLSCCSPLRLAACACKVPVVAALGRWLRGCAGQV